MNDTQQAPKLYRIREGRQWLGVCSGLARHTGIDPVVFRIGFVVTTLMSGFGLVAYLIAWLVIPEEGNEPIGIPEGWKVPVVVGLGALGVLALVQSTNLGAGWGFVLLLAGLGFALWRTDSFLDWRKDRIHLRPGAAPVAVATESPQADVGGPALGDPAESVSQADQAVAPAAPSPPIGPAVPRVAFVPSPPRPKRERSWLTEAALGTALMFVGAGVLLDTVGAVTFTLVTAAAGSLFILGLAMLVGGFFGRAKGLTLLALPLVLVLFAGSGVAMWDQHQADYYAPTSEAEVKEIYESARGRLSIDLRRLPPGSGEIHIKARNGVGLLQVVLPMGVAVRGNAKLGAGKLWVEGDQNAGLDLNEELVLAGVGESRTFVLDLELNVGRIEIIRTGPDLLAPETGLAPPSVSEVDPGAPLEVGQPTGGPQ